MAESQAALQPFELVLELLELLVAYLHLSHLQTNRIELVVKVFLNGFGLRLDSFVLRCDLGLHLQLPHFVPHRLDLIEFFVELVSLLTHLEQLIGSECSYLSQLRLSHHSKLG